MSDTKLPSNFTRITLQERPKDYVTKSTFKTERFSFPQDKLLGPKEVLVQANWISLDPAMRGWLNDTRSYVPPVGIGETMRAGGIGSVISVGNDVETVAVGDIVYGPLGWAEYAILHEKQSEKITLPPNADTLDFLGPLGMTGLTAYFGLLEVGKPKAGETLVVTGAAGATGSIVCQIGKLKGLKVIAIAGSPDKCEWLEKEIGVDKAIDYKSENFAKELRENVGYLDIMFDNVGGDILNLCLTILKKNARVVLCGAISQYNTRDAKGLTTYATLISQRAKIEGFIVFDYAEQYATARRELAEWIAQGKIKRKFHILEGIESCPDGLGILFTGGNTGKLVVKVADIKPISKL